MKTQENVYRRLWPNQPFWLNRPGQLAGNSERALGISFFLLYLNFNLFFKYETIVSRNDLSLGYSEGEASCVKALKDT